MDIHVERVLCCGCLCENTGIEALDERALKFYFKFVLVEKEVQVDQNTNKMCWICRAHLFGYMEFQEQVQNSYKKLKEYSLQSKDPTLIRKEPSLKNHNAFHFFISPSETNESSNYITQDVKLDEEIQKSKVKVELETSVEIIKYENDIFDNTDDITNDCDGFTEEDDMVLSEYRNSPKKKKSKASSKNKRVKTKSSKINIIKTASDNHEFYRVIRLTKEQLLEERCKLKLKEDYVNALYKCSKCITTFTNIDDLNDHNSKKHRTEAKSSLYICDICQYTFINEVSHKYHTSNHTKRFQCTACNEVFSSKKAVTYHHGIAHYVRPDFDMFATSGGENNKTDETSLNQPKPEEFVPYTCDFCPKTFKYRTSLRKHIEKHKIESGQMRIPYCEPCRLSFSTTSNLQKHVKISFNHQIQLKILKQNTPEAKAEIELLARESRLMYPCSFCEKTFQFRGNLSRHIAAHRQRAKGELVCKPCNRNFSSLATYQQHMKGSKKHVSESDYNYICNDCGKRFLNKSRLQDHVNWEHLKIYLHTCDECQKSFRSHTSLYLHKQVVHKTGKERLCHHCGRSFQTGAKLRCHMRALHSAESPYRCPQCSAKFNWRSCLSRHVRRVHNEKRKKDINSKP